MSQILERRAVQLTDLSTALDSIDSRTIGGYVVIKAVINQVQIPYSQADASCLHFYRLLLNQQ